MTCNPLTQAGCATGEKCTWLLDAVMPQYVGHVGCAPAGTAAIGDACMYGAPGATGYDDCVAGSVCSNYRGTGPGFCKQICDQQGGMPACPDTHVCVTYAGLFGTGDTTPAAGGVCDLACDPLEDNDFDGPGPDEKGSNTCGSADSVGCYGYPSAGAPPPTGWSCTNDINYDGSAQVGLRHRVPCTEANNCADAGPRYYVNSCNQGHLPLLYEETGSTVVICTAMCQPDVCYQGNCGDPVGANPAVGSQTHGKAPHRCRATDRVSATGGFDNTEHCQHLWVREIDRATGTLLPSKHSDTVGFCFNMPLYRYDSNGDMKLDTDDLQLPNCDQLQPGFGAGSDASDPTTYWGAADLGCVPTTMLPEMANGKRHIPESALRKRALLNVPRPLYNADRMMR